MKKVFFGITALFGGTIALAQSQSDQLLLQEVEKELFNGSAIASPVAEKLLELSPEDPKNIMIPAPKVTEAEVIEAEVIKIKNVARNYRRTYRGLKHPKPFYIYKNKQARIIDEPSIGIVKRRDQNVRRKAARYHFLQSRYGN